MLLRQTIGCTDEGKKATRGGEQEKQRDVMHWEKPRKTNRERRRDSEMIEGRETGVKVEEEEE